MTSLFIHVPTWSATRSTHAASWIEQWQSREIGSIEAAIAGKETLCMRSSVSPDQKVRDNAVSRSTTFSVSLPGGAGLQRGIDRERVELNSYVSHRVPDGLARCEEGAQLRPDDVARGDAALPKTPAKGL